MGKQICLLYYSDYFFNEIIKIDTYKLLNGESFTFTENEVVEKVKALFEKLTKEGNKIDLYKSVIGSSKKDLNTPIYFKNICKACGMDYSHTSL